MARTMIVDNVDIYRMLVSYQWTNGAQHQAVYGPYDASNVVRDHARSRTSPARLEKQKLDIDWDANSEPILAWVTIKTTYINGGEAVNWDE